MHMRHQGFSLVELVLSIALLILVFAAIVFNFNALGERSGFDEGARRFESFVRHARAEASLSGKTIRVELLPSTSSAIDRAKRVQVSIEDDPLNKPGQFSTLQGQAWAESEVDGLVDVVEVRSLESFQSAGPRFDDPSEPQLRSFHFFSDGSSDSVEIVLASKDAADPRRIVIRVYGLTGAVSRLQERSTEGAETKQRTAETETKIGQQ